MDRKRVNLLMVNILALFVAYLCAIVMQKQEFFFQAFPYILLADSFFVCYKLRNYKTLLIYAILIVIPLSNQWLHWNPNFGGFWPGGRGWYRTSRPLALLLAVFHESKKRLRYPANKPQKKRLYRAKRGVIKMRLLQIANS